MLKRHKELEHQVDLSNKPIELDVFECDICDKTFNLKSKLSNHMRGAHINKEAIPIKSKICTYCGKGFTNNQRLKIHHRVHTGERPYLCKYCKTSRFKDTGSLWNHYKYCKSKIAD